MDDNSDDFCDLMRRASDGSEDAARELVQRYGHSIRQAVRRALNKKLRSKFDSSDFVQFVWASLFRTRQKLDRFNKPEELAAFLVTMARNKVGMEVRRQLLTQKCNLNREVSLQAVESMDQTELPDGDPSPVDVAIARERWERMLQNQPHHYRKILEFKLQGCSCREIAASLRLAESTVRRFLKKLLGERAA